MLGVLFGLLGCATDPLHARRWVEVETAHFLILSPRDDAEAVELARDLELFRSVVEVVTGSKIPPSRVPVRVFAFDGLSSYRPFSIPNMAGYFIGSMRQRTIVLGAANFRGDHGRAVLQHEYVHFLLRNRGLHAYPPWYDEGFAEFLSSVRVNGDQVEVGRPLRDRIRTLRHVAWLSLDQVLARRNFDGLDPDQVAAFYGQSWLFVHYLQLGRSDANARSEMTQYLAALRNGSSNETAVQRGFGTDSGNLGHLLRRYYERGQFVFLSASPTAFEAGETPRSRIASASEVARALGELSNEIERYDQAERYFDRALAENPVDSRAWVGQARALAGQGLGPAAQQRYETALALAPTDALVQLDYARHLYEQARASQDPGERERLARKAREHYVQSWKLDDQIPETFAGYGGTFLLEGQDASRGRETLEHAHRMLPSSPEIKLLLARLYMKLGRTEAARELALVVATWSHSAQAEAEVQALLEEIGVSGER